MKNILLHFILCIIVGTVSAQEEKLEKIVTTRAEKNVADSINRTIEKAILVGKTDTASADKLFRNAIKRSNAANDPYLAGSAFYAMGQMYFEHKNHNRSFGAFFNARPNFERADAKKELAYTQYSLGRQQYFRGNYKVAAGHLNYAMRQAEAMKLMSLESDALEYLGVLYHVMPGTDQQSIEDFKRAYVIKEKLKDRTGMLRMQEKLGDVYYHEKYFDSALHCVDQAIELASALKLQHDEYISRLDRVGVLIRLKKLDDAQKDLTYIGKKGDTSDLNISLRYFIQSGNLLVASQKFEEAKLNYDRALQVADRIAVPDMYGLVYRDMAEAYSTQGKYEQAYQFSQQYNDQLMGYYAENMSAIKDLEFIFNNSLTRDEVAYLSGENKLKEVRLQNEKQLMLILLIGVVAFLLLAAAIFYLYRQQKNKNSIIKKQSEDLQTLMKEIHHRVKNNLQIISSLLDLQSMIVKDNQASQAIKEGRNRVQSMALIHQNLYGEKNVKGIAVDEYINNLTQSLFDSYNIRPGQIELKKDIDKIDMDVDTVIPIGLMLNELISNSLKHAFADEQGGRIEITLKQNNEILLLQVRDNGKGFPDKADPAHSKSFGMRMIKIFAQKLKADLDIYNDQGACILMRIRKYKLSA